MRVVTKVELEQQQFEHQLLHDLRAASIVIDRAGLQQEYWNERTKLFNENEGSSNDRRDSKQD